MYLKTWESSTQSPPGRAAGGRGINISIFIFSKHRRGLIMDWISADMWISRISPRTRKAFEAPLARQGTQLIVFYPSLFLPLFSYSRLTRQTTSLCPADFVDCICGLHLSIFGARRIEKEVKFSSSFFDDKDKRLEVIIGPLVPGGKRKRKAPMAYKNTCIQATSADVLDEQLDVTRKKRPPL